MPLMRNEGVATKTEIIGLIAKYRAVGGGGEFEGDDYMDRHADEYPGGHSDPALIGRCSEVIEAIEAASQELACAISNYCNDNPIGEHIRHAVLYQGAIYQARGIDEIDEQPWTHMVPLDKIHKLD